MTVKFEVHGLEDTKRFLKRKSHGVDLGVSEAMNKISLFMEREVKDSVQGKKKERRSVDTGRFANSVKGVNNKDTATIFSNVKYAKFLEFGTIKIDARHHFTNSLDRNKKKIKKFLSQFIKENIG